MSSSDDECFDSKEISYFHHWNNWTSKQKALPKNSSLESSNKFIDKRKSSFNRSSVRNSLLLSLTDNQKYGNWIPPNFLIYKSMRQSSLLKREDVSRKASNKINFFVDYLSDDSSHPSCSNSAVAVSVPDNKIAVKVLDWKYRKNSNNLFNISNEDFAWTVIDRGVLSQFKLWYNEYGNICGYAQGKIIRAGCSCSGLLIIDKPDGLRKLLNISQCEWSALCEGIRQNNISLKYDGYDNVDLSKLRSLEKLWVLLCQRRNLLPNMRITFCFNGAIKLMKEFQIVPKIIIKELYDIKGNEIL